MSDENKEKLDVSKESEEQTDAQTSANDTYEIFGQRYELDDDPLDEDAVDVFSGIDDINDKFKFDTNALTMVQSILDNDFINSMNEYRDRLESLPPEWANLISKYFNSSFSDVSGVFDELSLRPGAKWTNRLSHNGETITPKKNKIGSIPAGNISRNAASSIAQMATGDGTNITIPLYHSGFWVTIRTPRMSDVIRLQRQIALEKMMLGMRTSGYAFSNESTYVNLHLSEFISNHIVGSNVKGVDHDDLMSCIAVEDLYTLVWGLTISDWPKGFPAAIPCTAGIGLEEPCPYVERALVNIARMMFVDRSRLTEKQLDMLSRRKQQLTVDDLKTYKEEFGHSNGSIKCNNLSINLAIPSIERTLDAGQRWISTIENSLESTFGVSLRGDERREHLSAEAMATRIRTYAQWIDSIDVYDSEDHETLIRTIDSDQQDAIDEILDSLSSSSKGDDIIDQIVKFMSNTVVAFVGFPNYKCPSCGKSHYTNPDEQRVIIQYDIISAFFYLLMFKVERGITPRQKS